MFEVWVEHEKLMATSACLLPLQHSSTWLSLSTSNTTRLVPATSLSLLDYVHLQSSQTLADILQRKVASYGDDSGSILLPNCLK